jgi:catechol 2,3-dioxygenase-like lactoylglutathione lyase family enzyme
MRTRRAIRGLDHPIVGVRDLEQARRDWQRLGFTITPRGRHIGWGTANYCIMFPLDYIEILGVVDASQYVHGLDAFLVHREGLLGMALATDDADAAHAHMAECGLAGEPPQDLARILELPEGEARPAFRLVHPADPAALGLRGFIVQHLTPDLVRRAEWLDHANGARRIWMISVATANGEALAAHYSALLGAEFVHTDRNGVTVRLDGCTLHFGPPLDGAVGGLGMAVEVQDLRRAGDLLQSAGVPFEQDGGRIDIDPRYATGIALSFVTG